MYDYEISEQLFIDIWEKYGFPDEVDDADVVGVVEFEGICRFGQGEHDHLERHDHVEQEQGVEQLGGPVVHAHDPPCAHRRAHENEAHRADSDEHRPAEAGEEVRGFNAALVVLEPDERVAHREREGVARDVCLAFERVEQHQEDGEHPGNGDHREEDRPQCSVLWFLLHHASTSLEVVILFWMSATMATRMKNSTAFAWPTPSQPIRP